MQAGQVRLERLEVERSGDVEHREQLLRVGQGQGGPCRREGVAVDESEALVLGQLEAAAGKQAVREVGHRAEIGLADRAKPADPRHEALVQQGNDHLAQRGPHAGDALRVAAGQAQHGAPDDIGWGRLALGDTVIEHEALVEPLAIGRPEANALALGDPGGESVDRFAAGQRVLDHLAGQLHAVARGGGQLDALAMPGHRYQVLDGKPGPVQLDRHGSAISASVPACSPPEPVRPRPATALGRPRSGFMDPKHKRIAQPCPCPDRDRAGTLGDLVGGAGTGEEHRLARVRP